MGVLSFSFTRDHNTCLSHLPGLFWGSQTWKHVGNYCNHVVCLCSRGDIFKDFIGLFGQYDMLLQSSESQPLCIRNLKPHRDSCLLASCCRWANKGTLKMAEESRGQAGPGSLDSSLRVLYSDGLRNIIRRTCEWWFFLLLAELGRGEVPFPPGALPGQHLELPSTASAFTGFKHISLFS